MKQYLMLQMWEVRLERLGGSSRVIQLIVDSMKIGTQISLLLKTLFFITTYIATKMF